MDIRLTYEIPIPRDVAFRLFTAVGTWWPAAMTHPGQDVHLPPITPQAGSYVRCVVDGSPRICAEVASAVPDESLELTWWFRQRREKATCVKVHFSDVEYGTRLVFEHVGWSESNANHRERFNDWPVILWHFISAARQAEARLSRHV